MVMHPNEMLECPLHDEKIGVWCTVSSNHILGAIFFNQNVSMQVYINILEELYNQLKDNEKNTVSFN